MTRVSRQNMTHVSRTPASRQARKACSASSCCCVCCCVCCCACSPLSGAVGQPALPLAPSLNPNSPYVRRLTTALQSHTNPPQLRRQRLQATHAPARGNRALLDPRSLDLARPPDLRSESLKMMRCRLTQQGHSTRRQAVRRVRSSCSFPPLAHPHRLRPSTSSNGTLMPQNSFLTPCVTPCRFVTASLCGPAVWRGPFARAQLWHGVTGSPTSPRSNTIERSYPPSLRTMRRIQRLPWPPWSLPRWLLQTHRRPQRAPSATSWRLGRSHCSSCLRAASLSSTSRLTKGHTHGVQSRCGARRFRLVRSEVKS
jgi:hypothetical protein